MSVSQAVTNLPYKRLSDAISFRRGPQRLGAAADVAHLSLLAVQATAGIELALI
jgi:hypothetical protein